MSRFAFIVAVAALVALAGCGGGGGGSSSTAPISPNTITGKIVSNQSGNPPVGGVNITFGEAPKQQTATSKSDGTFQITLPTNTTVLMLFPNPPYTFSVSTASVTYFPTDRLVTYNGTNTTLSTGAQYAQSAITVPVQVLDAQSMDLGTIVVQYLNPNDPSSPPPPPNYTNSSGNSAGGSGNPVDSGGGGSPISPPPAP